MVRDMQASGSSERTAMADGSWLARSVGGLAGIWTAVVLISVLAPDLVSGSEQEHLPIAAFTTWLWGLVATGGFLWAMARLRGSAWRRPIWVGLAVAISWCCRVPTNDEAFPVGSWPATTGARPSPPQQPTAPSTS
jgi:hypothetical protein